MELAIREIGVVRIMTAFFFAAITKPLGIRGMFYVIAGSKARSIDGPTPHTIPPYNQYAVMAPRNPDKVAHAISNECDDVGVLNGLGHLRKRDAVAFEAKGIDADLELLGFAAVAYDIDHARDLLELTFENPVFGRLQLLDCVALALDCVAKDFSNGIPRRDRRLNARWQRGARLRTSFPI